LPPDRTALPDWPDRGRPARLKRGIGIGCMNAYRFNSTPSILALK